MLCSKDYFVGLYFWLWWNLWTLPQNQLCVGWQDFLLVPYLVWFIYRKEKHLQDILLCWWIMFLSMIHHAVVSLKHLGSMFHIVQQTFYIYSAINYWRVKELIVNFSIRSLFHIFQIIAFFSFSGVQHNSLTQMCSTGYFEYRSGPRSDPKIWM